MSAPTRTFRFYMEKIDRVIGEGLLEGKWFFDICPELNDLYAENKVYGWDYPTFIASAAVVYTKLFAKLPESAQEQMLLRGNNYKREEVIEALREGLGMDYQGDLAEMPIEYYMED